MRSGTIGLFILGTLAAGTGAMAQTMPGQPGSAAVPSVIAPAAPSRAAPAMAPAVTPPRTPSASSAIVEASTLEAGANSFTESQAKGRFEDAGFTSIQGLTKDSAGFWRGRGTRNGSASDIAMDFHGRIASGPGVATLGARGATPAPHQTTTGSAPLRDGTPGNPPSTMTGRAVDRLQGETPRADGTPGNPAGTALGRAADRATGAPPAAGTTTPSR